MITVLMTSQVPDPAHGHKGRDADGDHRARREDVRSHEKPQ